MRFADVIGNAEVAKALASMADSGRVAHAMFMYENEGCGALALALAYVQYLNCSNPHDGDSCGECPSCRQMAKLIHPDVHYVFPVNKGPKTSDEKPVSESYIKYWRELASANPYFTEADLQKAIGIESKNGLIAVAEAKNIMDTQQGYIILDVREDYEFANGHIPGAILLPNGDITSKAESVLTDKNQLILVYCRSGRRIK